MSGHSLTDNPLPAYLAAGAARLGPSAKGTRQYSVGSAVRTRTRGLAPGEPGYTERYEGGPSKRDACYHQGTVWPWLTSAFVDAWLRVHGPDGEHRAEAHRRFVAPLEAHLGEAGIGHVSEIADAEPPHTPRGCPFQAWSVGALIHARALTAAG